MFKLLQWAICLLLISTSAYSQTADERLAEIKGLWQTNADGFLQYKKTIELPGFPKELIYERAKEYYQARLYEKLDEKVAGAVIVLGGAGILKDVQVSNTGGITSTVDATHLLHVWAVDGKAELVITCIQYIFQIGSGSDAGYDEVLISNLYPVNPQAPQSDKIIGAFYGTTRSATARLEQIEKLLKAPLTK
ncbi:hypothetical protein [Telluribacter humicola]|uniref:hypothetical protein n=1 Tax=Telluribacter humicola TaxID=1720261 RepID=UPI001A95CACF|nr:hypothetical protein [Telluribacter humicola]